MPIYEYACMSCESHFEELVRHDESPACPDCGSTKAQKQLSVFAAHGASTGLSATQSGSRGAPSADFGGGCCGGVCGGH